MGGIALGKAVLSSGLLDSLNHILEELVHGMSLYSVLMVFSLIALVVATLCVGNCLHQGRRVCER
jgi:phosphate transporter